MFYVTVQTEASAPVEFKAQKCSNALNHNQYIKQKLKCQYAKMPECTNTEICILPNRKPTAFAVGFISFVIFRKAFKKPFK